MERDKIMQIYKLRAQEIDEINYMLEDEGIMMEIEKPVTAITLINFIC